jgi:hypothetical protein
LLIADSGLWIASSRDLAGHCPSAAINNHPIAKESRIKDRQIENALVIVL